VGVETLSMMTHLLEVYGCPSQKMTKCEFDVSVPRARIEEPTAIQFAFGDLSNEFSDADFAKFKLRLGDDLSLALHDIGISQDLLVDRSYDLFFFRIIIPGDQLKGCFAFNGKALNS